MTKLIRASFCLLVILCANVLLSSCVPDYQPKNKSEQAITDIRAILELPQNTIVFIENTKMINSPNGDLQVAHYQDADGRDYYVDIAVDKVVEIDARKLLTSITNNSPAYSENEIKSKVDRIIEELFPTAKHQLDLLTYKSNRKIDNYFFSWRDNAHMGALMPPFLQFGFHKSGFLFAYDNTLMIK